MSDSANPIAAPDLPEESDIVLRTGATARLRPVRPEDAPAVEALHGRLSSEALYFRFLGIPASKQKVVFREFHRLDQGAKVARGLGLGLSIVERIGRVLDHPVTLNSDPGRGSVFRVEVPVVAALPGSLAPVETPRIAATPLTSGSPGPTAPRCSTGRPSWASAMRAAASSRW